MINKPANLTVCRIEHSTVICLSKVKSPTLYVHTVAQLSGYCTLFPQCQYFLYLLYWCLLIILSMHIQFTQSSTFAFNCHLIQEILHHGITSIGHLVKAESEAMHFKQMIFSRFLKYRSLLPWIKDPLSEVSTTLSKMIWSHLPVHS